MASTAEIAKRYFEALDAHELEDAVALWAPGAVDRFVGAQELVAPDGVRDYFSMLFAAFPDFSLEVLELITSQTRTAVRWRAAGTFAGPGQFQGFAPNGAALEFEGCDVMTVEEDRISHNDAYVDTAAIARQLGILPQPDSKAQTTMTKASNLRTKLRSKIQGDDPERIADGVWIVRGGFPLRTMNVYLIEDDGGVTLFDAGISDMADAIRSAGALRGGIKRIVLGHVDADHRGAAPGLDAPVYCHPAESQAAASSSAHRDYWDYGKLPPHARVALRKLNERWDGGPVQIEGTVSEGDQIAGFRVIDLPGHAPGLIGLFRESDGLALISDCIYTLDVQSGIKGPARVPHPAFNIDTDQARGSIRKLAALSPTTVWAGHADPVSGDVSGELDRAAAEPVS